MLIVVGLSLELYAVDNLPTWVCFSVNESADLDALTALHDTDIFRTFGKVWGLGGVELGKLILQS